MGKRVLSCGTFDHLHPGHESFLQQAAALGTELCVVVARDENVERLKGRHPDHDEEERMAALGELPYVTEVRLGYPGKNLLRVVEEIAPDIIALGYDQKSPPGLREAFPDLELKLVVNDFFEQLRHDEYDLAIYYRPIRPADHEVTPLAPEEMLPVMAPGGVPLVEQAAPVLLTVEETHKEWTDWGNWLSSAGHRLPDAAMRWKLGDYHLSVESARRGIGIAMGWTWFIVDHLESGALVPADVRPFRGHGQYYLMRPTTRHQRRMARQVGDWLVDGNRLWQGV